MLRSSTGHAPSLRRRAAMLPLPLLGSLLAAIALAGCDSGKSKEPAAEAVQRPVLVTPVEYRNIAPARSLAAVIRPRIESDLGFRVNGKVAKRLVQNGDQVRKGQPLLLLDTNDLELQLQQAEAEMKAATTSLAQAEADEKRTTKLEKDGWSPTAMLDKARSLAAEARGRLIRAQRAVELATNAHTYATLEADADGIITATPVEPGQVVAAGQPVVRLAHTGELEALVALPETYVERARNAIGKMTLWSLPGRAYEVRLRELSPAADGATRTYAARYSILDPDGAVRIGMSATLTLTEGESETAARLPLTAVFNHARGARVWVVDGAGKLTARPVTIARYEGQSVLIKSGVKDGEKVVTLGVEQLDEGLAVRPMQSLTF